MDKLNHLIEQWQSKEMKVQSNLITIEENQSKKQVIEVLNELKANLARLVKLGEQYDYSKDLKYNGFRSFVKMNCSAIDRVEKTLNKQFTIDQANKSKVEKCLSFLRFMNKLNTLLLDTYTMDQALKAHDNDENRRGCKLLFSEKMTTDLFETYFLMKEDLKIYFDGHLSFYLSKRLRLLVRSVSTFLLKVSNFPFSLFIPFTRKKKLNALSDFMMDPTITWPASMEIVNKPIINFVVTTIATFRNRVQSQTIFLPKQRKWLLKSLEECDATDMIQLFDYRPDLQDLIGQDLKKDGLRVRFIRHASRPKDGVVMFHCHGGAFIYHSPDCHEAYLQEFVKKIPNLYIMSVDYTLRKKYGRAHQDVLDAYLWLTSDLPDVIELFGFKPKKIIIVGDSAGAFLSFTLCKIMKDIENYVLKKNLNEKLIVPNTIINFYGFATLNKLSPSLLITFVEAIVTLPTLRIGFGSLVFGCEEQKFTRRIFLPFLTDRKERWYSIANSNRINYSNEFVEKIQRHPYLEPIDHMDFDQFKDTKLYLITSEFDVFLDANIELARKWKGHVELTVFDEVSHGFLQFSLIDSVSKKSVNSSVEVLKLAISRLTDSA